VNKKSFSLFEYLKSNLTLLPIDFEKPWWHVVIQQKFFFIFSFVIETLVNIFRPLSVIFIGWIFAQNQLEYLLYFFGIWALLYILEYFSRVSLATLELRAMHSTRYGAHQWFLKVDPIYHARRSSGTILGKIERASRTYEEFLDACYLDLLETIVGIITVIISLSFYSWKLGIIASAFLALIMILTILITFFSIQPQEKKVIKADDKFRNVSVENLAQIHLIRTTFSSNQLNNRLKRKTSRLIRKEGNLWFSFNLFYESIKLTYLCSLFILSYYIFTAIQYGNMSIPIGVSLVLSYLRGTYKVVRIERPIRYIMRSITRIQDLFTYIQNFGQQTFPVLKPAIDQCVLDLSVKQNNISIMAKNLFFDYTPTAKIFDDHNLILNVAKNKEHNLYGIIGPSGIGKSTLILLLGGQLKPTSGDVLINDIDIYHIDDSARQQLIALQGQVATSVRGTLRYNLLFGLPVEKYDKKRNPKKYAYSDEQLTDILQKVGLWNLFEVKNGLDTFIGEGGLNLSGGQRQRLNFANLYLRASYFKPALILIDEPTSSLDEISERAITDMISTLAQDAVTMVIAHRLRTISNAVGILDFSLIAKEKDILFYTHDKLKKKSEYYKRLMGGFEPLDI